MPQTGSSLFDLTDKPGHSHFRNGSGHFDKAFCDLCRAACQFLECASTHTERLAERPAKPRQDTFQSACGLRNLLNTCVNLLHTAVLRSDSRIDLRDSLCALVDLLQVRYPHIANLSQIRQGFGKHIEVGNSLWTDTICRLHYSVNPLRDSPGDFDIADLIQTA